MTDPAPGMDHELYRYSALPTRPRLEWPGGARVAFWVLLHLEYWELEPPADAYRDPRFQGEYGFYFPEYRPFTQREYGNRIGIFRIFDLLDRHGIKASVAANAAACERYPYLVEECLRRGYEFVAHGDYQTRMITSRMDEAEERRVIETTTETVATAAGTRPCGWLGPDSGESPRTPQLLAAAGYDYLLDWPNDDQPYLMTTEPSLVSIPNQMELDDVLALWLRRIPNPRYPDLVGEAFRVLHREGAVSGRLFGLSLHPWVIGQPQRIRYLDRALANIATFDDVWQATAGEIARHYRSLSPPAESAASTS
jgi:peptidoglycan/xylan/chitin deacetylase (PgdA/CDA1 family)